ncbi:MAG: NHL repeat-containing protein [Nitrospirae bacterium]|nr:NHL repeat-containing protein [Nitrospirota bacterium]
MGFFVLCFLFVITVPLYAQQTGAAITYYDSITYDDEDGSLSFPSAVFVDPVMNEIYVIDGKSRINIYTSDLFPLYSIGKNNGIQSPQGLTVDSAGYLYVGQTASLDNHRNRISVFNACLHWDRDIYFEGFDGADSFVPYRMAVDKKGILYVSGSYFPGILVLDIKGKFLDIISVEEEGRKVKINNAVLDNSGKLYLVSEEEGRVYVYDANNKKMLFKFGEKGGSSGKLSRPRAVAVDNRNGRIFVVDYMRHTVSVYNSEGTYIFEFGGLGWDEGWFQFPTDIAIDKDGKLAVADIFNNRIQVFNAW